MKYIQVSVFALLMVYVTACNDSDNQVEENITGNAKLVVTILNDGQPLTLDTRTYTNAAGNDYTVSEFKFYLSNVKLRNTNTGALYIEPDSYHLVERTPESHIYEIDIPEVTLANYNELEFAIGVDNSQNYSLDNIGALDPSNNMAWDWNTGYKFLLLEGKFTAQNEEQAGIIFHIGGDSNYKRITLPTDNDVAVSSNKSAIFYIDVEVSQIFTEPTTINFNTNNVVMFDSLANKVAANFAKNVFSLTNVED
jgi:hypothetical protein